MTRSVSLRDTASRDHGSATVGMGERFNHLADRLTTALGSFPALAASVLLIAVWAMTGPFFHFSDTWQLFVNTTTTVVTFWMVFVIQNSANRSTKATQLKLDEIIRALDAARNEFITLDKAGEEVLSEREAEFEQLVNDETDRGQPPAAARKTARPEGAAREGRGG